jgi:hypothetical protein
MSYPKKEEIIKLIQKVNESKKREKKGLFPLEFSDDGWRIVFPKVLENYDFISAGKKLLEMSVYDIDFEGGYYWIPISNPPNNVTTPALKLRSF